MDKFALIHFAVKKNDFIYYFVAQPNAPLDGAMEALADFAKEMEETKKLQEETKKLQEEAAKNKDMVSVEQAEAAPLEAEVLN